MPRGVTLGGRAALVWVACKVTVWSRSGTPFAHCYGDLMGEDSSVDTAGSTTSGAADPAALRVPQRASVGDLATRDDALTERRLTLKYPGTCRRCRRSLAAGTQAVHDRATRSVRCVACPERIVGDAGEATPTIKVSASEPGTGAVSLAHRAPASAVIAEALRLQSDAPSRSRFDRFIGRSPLARDAESWFSGALGEMEVARELAALGPEWRVFHALPVGTHGSDIDHLVIGPAGVFTINTKHHAGRSVWVGERRLMVDGQRTDHLRNSEHEASRAARLLSNALGSTVDVSPLLAIVGARHITEKAKPARVIVLSAARMTRWLRSRPEMLSFDSIEAVAAVAADLWTWNAPTPPEPDLEAFARLRADVARARVRCRVWAITIAACAVALLISAPSWLG